MSYATFLVENMTDVNTENTLKPLNKAQLIDLFLKMEDQRYSTINSLMAEMKDLNNSFKRLESSVQIVKTGKNNLLKQPENIERQYWANAKYSCCECVEVIGIIKPDELEDCKTFNSIGFDIGEGRVEACHWLTKLD